MPFSWPLSIALCSLALGAAAAAAAAAGEILCKDVVIPVVAKANNTVLPSHLTVGMITPALLHSIVSGLDSTPVGGKFNIAGRYCEPAVDVPKRRDSLQLLVHGITYTRSYWSGLGSPTNPALGRENSWILYASQQGYPTLSVDRLCNGESSHPNGLAACQLPLEADTMIKVVQAARSGKIPGVAKKFTKIIWAGHSYGSLVANGMAAQYDSTGVDSFILTGFTDHLLDVTATIFTDPKFVPSKLTKPNPPTEPNDPSYVQATSQSGATRLFYYGNYSQRAADYDYSHRHTVTVGEIPSVVHGQRRAPAYRGSVFVMNGRNDNLFCIRNDAEPLYGSKGHCVRGKSDWTAEAAKLYPNAIAFGSYNVPETGHCINIHRTAYESFEVAHKWLAKQGF